LWWLVLQRQLLQMVYAKDQMIFAYADPPYFGMGKKMYQKHHDQKPIFGTIE
jgi:site-specific DNA-adenine methylase